MELEKNQPAKNTSWIKANLGTINSLGLMVTFLLMAAGFYFVTNAAIPKYEQMFEYMEIELPTITQVVIGPYFYLPLFIFAIVAVLKENLLKDKMISSTINWFLIWTIPVYITLYWWGISAPMIAMMDGISQ